jgi:hypothetical protein
VPAGGISKFGPWRGPEILEQRDPGVIVAAGEISDETKTVPAVAVIPTVQPPGTGPDPMGEPKPGEPGPYPGAPAGKRTEGPLALIATGKAAEYLQALVTNETGYRIRMEQAVQLGLLNSREFQDRREDLYLAALPVTLERFSFAAQGFFTEAAFLDFAGRALGQPPRDRANLLTETGFAKLFPSGALLLVRLANQVVIDLSNAEPTVTLSNFSLSLAQPFLQGGGYAVTLEPLTLVERNMLYAIRSFARFRKLFYVAVTAGGNITNNPYSLAGLSVNLGRGIGGNLTAPSVGYLSLLLQSAVLSNQATNVEALDGLLRLFQAFREGGQYSDLQVAQVEQRLIDSRNDLLGSSNAQVGGGGGGSGIRGYLDTLDNFKLQLGVPLTVGLDLDDTPLQPIRDQLQRFDSLYADVREVEVRGRRFDPTTPIADFRGRWRELLTNTPLVKGTEFAKQILGRWAVWEKMSQEDLTKRLADLAEERRKILDARADREVKGLPPLPGDEARLKELSSEIDLGGFERAVRIYETQPWAREKGSLRNTIQTSAFRDAFNAFFQVILEGRNERLESIRQQWPKLPPIIVNGRDLLEVPLDDATTAGIQAALSNRLDLMNARGQVVDAWRQIKIQANSLQGVLDVQYNLDSSTPPGGANPVAFSGSRTNHNVTIQGELPLVRRAERNQYRAALIGYQRQRRTLMSFEDNIANDVRSDIRGVRTIAELYKVQQRLVELGYFQFDNAQAVLLEPPEPGAQAGAGDAAALTNQVLQAQSSLLSAQNSLYQIYVNYLVARMTLYLDLELMQIDERGVWFNEYHTGNEGPGPVPAPDAPRGERLPPPRAIVEPGRD